MSDTSKPSTSRKPKPIQSRGTVPAPLLPSSPNSSPYNPYAWMESEDLTPAQAALRMSNEHLARRMAKLQANSARLKREIFLLQRHVREFDHPLFETWEADILTRLIEVACARQRNRVLEGVAVGQNLTERESISRAYVNAAKQVQETTMYKLGLSDQYYQAVLRYEEVAAYRSPNPCQTETPFAKWLVEEKDNRPEKYAFWAKLYPVCYGRSVEQSASIF